jgi:phenylacetate-CoA ligase
MRDRLGESVRVDIEKTDLIPPEKSGKFRYVVSRVAAGDPDFRD